MEHNEGEQVAYYNLVSIPERGMFIINNEPIHIGHFIFDVMTREYGSCTQLIEGALTYKVGCWCGRCNVYEKTVLQADCRRLHLLVPRFN
jgi:hypothetical protein